MPGATAEFVHQLRVGMRGCARCLTLAARRQDRGRARAARSRTCAGWARRRSGARLGSVRRRRRCAAIAPHVMSRSRRRRPAPASARVAQAAARIARRRSGEAVASPRCHAAAARAGQHCRIGLDACRRAESRSRRRARCATPLRSQRTRELRKRGKRLRARPRGRAPPGAHRSQATALRGRDSSRRCFAHAAGRRLHRLALRSAGRSAHLNDMATASACSTSLATARERTPSISRSRGHRPRLDRRNERARARTQLAKAWRQFAKAKPFWN